MKAVCYNCLEEYEKYDKPRRGHHGSLKRPHKSITCSKKCSREFIRYKEKIKSKGCPKCKSDKIIINQASTNLKPINKLWGLCSNCLFEWEL